MKYSTPETTTESKLQIAERRITEKPEIVGLQSYEYLISDSSVLQPHFISGELASPPLHYSKISLPGLEKLAHETHVTLMELNSGPRSAKIDALFDAIEVRYAELHMLELASLLQDPALPETERREAEFWFKEANEAIFGKPDMAIFANIADKRLYDRLERDDFTGDAAEIQQDLRELVGPRPSQDVPRTELFTVEQIPDHVADLIHERFDYLVNHINATEEYDLDGIVHALKVGLEKMDAHKLGWRVEIVPNKDHLAVSAHRKVVEVGENREDMLGDELQAKTVHEIGVHVLRSLNAQSAGWVSAEYGQDGYLDFEEAFANMCGAVYRAPGTQTLEDIRYLIAGLAYGMDGQPKRAFRECYEIIWRTIALGKAARGTELTEKSLASVRKDAYQQCVRMYRGTPCHVPGLLFLKDLSYVHGKELVGRVLPAVETLDDLELLLAGKLDPTRPDHLRIADDIYPNTPLATLLESTNDQ